MSTHSIDGREWAKLSELEPGDVLLADGDFTCGIANKERLVGKRDGELFVTCNDGKHYLDGQLSDEDGDHLVGFWLAGAKGRAKAAKAETSE